jgi:hypothetical protein
VIYPVLRNRVVLSLKGDCEGRYSLLTGCDIEQLQWATVASAERAASRRKSFYLTTEHDITTDLPLPCSISSQA